MDTVGRSVGGWVVLLWVMVDGHVITLRTVFLGAYRSRSRSHWCYSVDRGPYIEHVFVQNSGSIFYKRRERF